jgi:DNA-binding GntR family transcriptional regulator
VIKDAELADRLGVSITPVREAIVLLSAEGLIDISPNRTRRVTDVTQKNALELIDVMRVLACAGVESGVPNLTGADLARMRRLLVLTPERGQWRPWIDGYTEVLRLLEQDDPQAAVARYRQIYAEVRAGLESGEAAAQGLVAARPDPLR